MTHLTSFVFAKRQLEQISTASETLLLRGERLAPSRRRRNALGGEKKKKRQKKKKKNPPSSILHRLKPNPRGGKRCSLRSPAHSYDDRLGSSVSGRSRCARMHTLAMRKQTLNQRERGSLHHQHHSCKRRCGEQEVQYSRSSPKPFTGLRGCCCGHRGGKKNPIRVNLPPFQPQHSHCPADERDKFFSSSSS